jgi:ATP-dependent RNA helicase DeaD
MRYGKIEIRRMQVPSQGEAENSRLNQILEKVKSALLAKDLDKYVAYVEKLVSNDITSLDVAAALLKMQLPDPSKSGPEPAGQIQGNGNVPYPSKQQKRRGRNPETARIALTIGKNKGIRPSDIVGAIAGETGLDGKQIGHIEIREKMTFVDVPEAEVDRVVNKMLTKRIKGSKIHVFVP